MWPQGVKGAHDLKVLMTAVVNDGVEGAACGIDPSRKRMLVGLVAHDDVDALRL
jgi:hypothetical protein